MLAIAETTWAMALAVTLCAGYIDFKIRRIPNWLTVSGFFVGLLVNTLLGGWRGTLTSLEGAAVGLIVLLPLVLMRGFGAGDWKLMGAIGALMGWRLMLLIFFLSCLLSAGAGLIQIILTGRVKQTFKNMWYLVTNFIVLGFRPHPDISLDNPTLAKLPFGTAVAAATALEFVLAHWRH